MHLLAIPASNSRTSINKAVLEYAAQLFEEGVFGEATVEFIDLTVYEFAIYSPERQSENGVPELAHELFDKIGAADGIMISFAEYNGSYSPAWKNTYDWMSRIDQQVYQDKPVAMFATSPGGRGGAGVLGSATLTAPFFGADLVGQLSIGRFADNVTDGRITNPELDAEFRQVLTALAAAAGQD